MHIVDEAAYLEHPDIIDMALSQTTRCRVDVSSAHGMGNPFARKRHSWPADKIMTILWRDDPRKDDAWYKEQCERYDPIVVAQEIDINYMASVEGILIPAAWVNAAIDADKKLGIEITGGIRCSLDIADEGPDKNALTVAQGIKVIHAEDWSGEASNLFKTLLRSVRKCDELQCSDLIFDSDGMGVSVRGDSEVMNEQRVAQGLTKIATYPFHASGKIEYPEREDVQGRLNADAYSNAKAQAWWRLRMRFEKTYKLIEEYGLHRFHEEELNKTLRAPISLTDEELDGLIVLDGSIPILTRLQQELAQVIYGHSMTGKLQIIKADKGMASPNLADSIMMLFGVKTEAKLAVLQKSEMVIGDGVDFPSYPACVFGVIVANMRAGKDTDGAAAVYCAHSEVPGHPIIILDWDVTEMDSRLLDDWMAGAFAKLEILSKATKSMAGSLGMWFKDDTTGLVFLNRADKMGFPAQIIESELDDVNRALTVSGSIRDGEVRLSRDSVQKVQNFKGMMKNHLTAQINEFNPSIKDLDGKVVLNAFTHAIALSKGNVDGY